MFTKRKRWKALLLLALLATGCAEKLRYDAVPLAPVRGRVLVSGQPAVGAVVRFYPRGDSKSNLVPVAKTGADGTFALTTYENQDGAPPGEYDVTLRLEEPGGKNGEMVDRFRGQYADPKKSAWQVRVEDRPNELDPFVVK